jgi:hypothetical protein
LGLSREDFRLDGLNPESRNQPPSKGGFFIVKKEVKNMMYERGDRLLYTPPRDANDVVGEGLLPYTDHYVVKTETGFKAVVQHRSEGLEPMFTVGEAVKSNGETDETLIVTALSEAAGVPGNAVTLFNHIRVSEDVTKVDMIGQEGTPWVGRGATLPEAVLTVFSAILKDPTAY